MLLMSSADFFKLTFFKTISFRNVINVANSLDQDQARHFVGPDLGPSCLEKFSADDNKKSTSREMVGKRNLQDWQIQDAHAGWHCGFRFGGKF